MTAFYVFVVLILLIKIARLQSGKKFKPANKHNLSYFLSRRKPIPSLPNQASEGQAHCMMELAKRLLLEAGGSQSTVIFNASQGSQNNPQRSGIFLIMIRSKFPPNIIKFCKFLQVLTGSCTFVHF